MGAGLEELLFRVPNIPWDGAPVGPSADANTVVRRWGEPPSFDHPVRDHVEILERNGWAELERVTRVSGSRTYCLAVSWPFLSSRYIGGLLTD